jgi:ubiquinone biosynthesis protein Coq4
MNPVMKFLDRIQMMRFFFQLVADPTRTDNIFKLLPIFVRSANPQQLADFEAALLAHDGFRKQWEERFVPKQPSLDELAVYPEGTFGRALHDHLAKYHLDLEFYPVMKIDRPVDYLSVRMSQDHDFVHALLGRSIEVRDELAIQAFGVAQVGSLLGVVLVAGGLLHLFRKDPKQAIEAMNDVSETYQLGKRAMNLTGVRLREHLDRPIVDVRKDFGLTKARAVV